MTLRERIPGGFVPSAWLKDTLIGGVGVLAIRISYVYLKAFTARPDLLSAMGPGVILGILAISIAGVLVNRLVEALGSAASRQADAAEAQATQTQHLAQSYSSIANSMHAIALKDDRERQEMNVGITALVVDVRRMSRKQHGQDRALERIENKLGINRAEVERDDDDA